MNLKKALEHEIFTILKQCSKELGVKSYVIGGYVRDFLLEKECKDIDVVVEGKGILLAEAFAKAVESKEVAIYENFGTAMVNHKDYMVEFVGARKESYQRESRKPIVEEGTLADDQLRRDFTINALSLSLNEADFGDLHDPFQGLEDLKNGIIRTPTNPDITFSDDPLRMMRGIRFASRLNFHIEEKTYQSISHNKNRIKIISVERINEELNKMIMAKTPSKAFKLLFNTGLLAIIFPELQRMHGVEMVNGRAHKDNFYHTLQVLDNVAEKNDNLWLRWVAILHDIGKPLTKKFEPEHGWTFHGHEDKGGFMVPDIFRKLKLPLNEKMKYVQKLVRLHQRPIALVNEVVSDSAIRRIVVDAGEDLDDLLLFCRCDITSRIEEKVKRFLNNYELLEKRIKEVEERDNLRNWQPPVTGEMIMEYFQIPPGKEVGVIKNTIREAILEGIIPNEATAAFEYMKKSHRLN
jgi:poly(A) polymerase